MSRRTRSDLSQANHVGAFPRGAAARAGRRGAFTLIELLVVIAIIALLMTMLLPVLRRAKELARRSICATNVKSLLSTMAIYSSQNANRVPLGYQGNSEFRQTDYLVNQGVASQARPNMHYGCLVKDKLIGNPRNFYCPSSTFDLFQFNTEINPWLRPGSLSTWTRFGYGTRPLAAWDPSVAWVCYGWPDRAKKEMPRQDLLPTTMTVVADIISTRDYVDTHHGDVVNYGLSGGSVHRFTTVDFNGEWQAWRGYTLHANDYIAGDVPTGTGFYDSYTRTGAWFDLDRAQGG